MLLVSLHTKEYTIQDGFAKHAIEWCLTKAQTVHIAILKLSGNYLLSNESAIILIATPVTAPAIKPVMSLFGFVDS